MDIHIDITKNIKDQFDTYLNFTKTEKGFRSDPSIIEGEIQYIEFPGELEFYHFPKSQFKVPINMNAVNPADTKWFLIHINLSKIKQVKTVGDKVIEFQKYLPIGILLYGPNLEINTHIPPNVDSELASIHFNESFLKSYFDDWDSVIDRSKNLMYEDLDPVLEAKINLALSEMGNKMKCHVLLLDFMQAFFEKLKKHDKETSSEKLHPNDLKKIFEISVHLRNPTSKKTPSLDELAAMANMGKTKFKSSFKQVFGKPPMEYHHKIKMEYARSEIQKNVKTPTEISYLLGYSHPSNFTKAYKKYFGELPSSQS